MGVLKVNVFILVLLFVSLASSRTILEDNNSKEIVGAEAPVVKDDVESVKSPDIHGREYQRIPCDYEEATEDKVCQDHCLPKGYNYGLCVSKTCSCI